jgi:tRNA A37 threonylcarbamoyladenosine dehydratase
MMATLRQGDGMNDKLRNVLKKRYEADIEDAKYKIKCYSEHELVIPEHPDITAEVDKLLLKMAEAEDKLAVMSLHYGEKEADKPLL